MPPGAPGRKGGRGRGAPASRDGANRCECGLRRTVMLGAAPLITLGTGAGSAVFSGGMLHRNSETGHHPVDGRPAGGSVSAATGERG